MRGLDPVTEYCLQFSSDDSLEILETNFTNNENAELSLCFVTEVVEFVSLFENFCISVISIEIPKWNFIYSYTQSVFQDDRIRTLYLSCTIIAVFFIVITVMVFLMCSEIQNCHGWTQFSSGVCLTALLVTWALADAFGLGDLEGSTTCFIIGNDLLKCALMLCFSGLYDSK